MATTHLTSLQDAARYLLDDIEAGKDVQLEITERDTETGTLFRLILELHEAAIRRQTGVVIEPVTADTIRLRISASSK